MSDLERAREAFYSALEGLKEVHTRDELETQMREVRETRAKLLESDLGFRQVIEKRQNERRALFDTVAAPHMAKVNQARAEERKARLKAKEATRKK